MLTTHSFLCDAIRWSANHRTDLGPRTLSPWARLLAYVAIAEAATPNPWSGNQTMRTTTAIGNSSFHKHSRPSPSPTCRRSDRRTSEQMNSKMPDQLHLTLGTLVHLLGLRHWTRTLDLGPWRHLFGLGHWPRSLDLGHSRHLLGLEHWPWTLDLGPSRHLLGLEHWPWATRSMRSTVHNLVVPTIAANRWPLIARCNRMGNRWAQSPCVSTVNPKDRLFAPQQRTDKNDLLEGA